MYRSLKLVLTLINSLASFLFQDFNKMAEENKFLRDELLRLRATNKDLEGKLDRHRKYCNMDTGSNGHH